MKRMSWDCFCPGIENNRKGATRNGGRSMTEYFASRSPEISLREKTHMEAVDIRKRQGRKRLRWVSCRPAPPGF